MKRLFVVRTERFWRVPLLAFGIRTVSLHQHRIVDITLEYIIDGFQVEL